MIDRCPYPTDSCSGSEPAEPDPFYPIDNRPWPAPPPLVECEDMLAMSVSDLIEGRS